MYCVQGQRGEVIDEMRRAELIIVEGGDGHMEVHCIVVINLPQ